MVYREQQLDKEIVRNRAYVRSVYEGERGREVLAHDILKAGLFAELHSDEDVMRHNVMVQRLDDMGVLDEEMVSPFVKWLLGQPLHYRELAKEGSDDEA